MDPLSDVLSLMKPHTFVAGGFDLKGDWSIQFDAHSGIKCWSLVAGACLLVVDGTANPVPLKPGDCILLPTGRRYRLATNMALVPTAFRDLPTIEWRAGMATSNGGGETVILGGHFAFGGAETDMLLGTMPAAIQLSGDNEKAGLRWTLERLRQELAERLPGTSLVAQHLAHLILVQVLRLYLAEDTGSRVGWLSGLAHPQLAAAIGAIHADPGRRWRLPALAAKAGMSRSTFAQTFKAVVGSSPIEYLTQWRMLLGGSRLREGAEPVSAIALSLGYESEAAFSTAFKRVMGCSPRQYAQTTATTTAVDIWRADRSLTRRSAH